MLKRFGSTNYHQYYRFLPLLVALLLGWFGLLAGNLAFALQTNSAPTLTASTALSKEGYVTLSVAPDAVAATPNGWWLEQSQSANFNELQKRYPLLGDSAQITVSGLANDSYWFRFTDAAGVPVTQPVQVTVEHYTLTQALGWFGAGAVLFVLLLWLLLSGHRQAMSESAHSDITS